VRSLLRPPGLTRAQLDRRCKACLQYQKPLVDNWLQGRFSDGYPRGLDGLTDAYTQSLLRITPFELYYQGQRILQNVLPTLVGK
jgi:hypothetical protein